MAVDVGSAVGYLDLDISGFLKGLRSAEDEANKSSKNIVQKIGGNFDKAGKKLSSFGKIMTATVTTPILAAGTAAFKFANDFETSAAKVSTIADPTKKSIGKIKDEIADLSNEMGISASSLAEATYQAISASVDTADAVAFVAEASKLAKAGFTDATTAVDILTTVINAYGLEAKDAAHISDVLISTQNKGKTTVDELASSMGKIIPTANAYGVSLEDLSTAYSYMTMKGIATAESTTYLNGMLNELGKSGTTVSDTLKNKTGKSFQELMDSGYSLRDVIDILQTAANKAGVGFNDLWSSQEAGKAALSLLSTSTDEYNGTLEDFLTTVGDVDGAYEKMADTTENKLAVAFERGKNIAIELGGTLGEMLLPYIEKGIDLLGQLSGWLSSLEPEQQQQIIKIVGIVAAAGPLLLILGKIMSLTGGLITGIGDIAGAFGKLAGKATEAVPGTTSSSSALKSLSTNAKGLLAAGAAIVLVATGLGILAYSSIQLAEAGWPAIAVMAGMTAAMVGMGFGIVALGSAGAALKNLSTNAVGLLAAGAAIILVATGLAILANSSIQLAGAGGAAIAVMAGMVVAVAGLAAGAAALAPALTAGSVGLIAFGAAVALIGVGIMAATSGLASLAEKFPVIAEYGLQASVGLAAFTAASALLGTSVVVCTAGIVAFMVALAPLTIEMGLAAAAAGLLSIAFSSIEASMATIGENTNTITNSILTFSTKTLDEVSKLPGGMRKHLNSCINDLNKWATDMELKGKDGAKRLVNGVISEGKAIAPSASSVGAAIVDGVWAGIESRRGSFYAQVRDFFAEIVDQVKAELGINSPAKAFVPVGQWIPPGVVVGVEKAMPKAIKDIRGLFRDGVNSLSTGYGFAEDVFYEMIMKLFRMAKETAGLYFFDDDGYVPVSGYRSKPKPAVSGAGGNGNVCGGDTYNFYSPKAIDEIQAAKLMKRTKRDMAEGS